MFSLSSPLKCMVGSMFDIRMFCNVYKANNINYYLASTSSYLLKADPFNSPKWSFLSNPKKNFFPHFRIVARRRHGACLASHGISPANIIEYDHNRRNSSASQTEIQSLNIWIFTWQVVKVSVHVLPCEHVGIAPDPLYQTIYTTCPKSIIPYVFEMNILDTVKFFMIFNQEVMQKTHVGFYINFFVSNFLINSKLDFFAGKRRCHSRSCAKTDRVTSFTYLWYYDNKKTCTILSVTCMLIFKYYFYIVFFWNVSAANIPVFNRI